MKRTIQKLTVPLTAILLMITVARADCQDSIVYFGGPSFPIPYCDAAELDLNQDGVPDFSFEICFFVCTADVPTSGCYGPFEVAALGTNAVLHRSSRATILPFGALIGNAPPDATWSSSAASATVASYHFSPRFGTSGYGGPLTDVGVGYLGVRFSAADGWHYGWIRVRMPTGAEFSPVIVDWAYESRPETPIAAGVIGIGNAPRQFRVDFLDGHTGSLILLGNTLRCELGLSGEFASANLRGPAPNHAQAKPVADFGQPLVVTPNYTSFLRDVTLSRGSAAQLLRGASHVSVDGGLLVGGIFPFE